MRYVEVIFKCKCMAKEATVMMRERGQVEDVADFMEAVTVLVCLEHRKLSPLCQATTLEYVKMPVTESTGIGYASGGNA